MRSVNFIFAILSKIPKVPMRFFLVFLLSITTLVGVEAQSIFHSEIIDLARGTGSEFPFGVASGDPGPDRILLWTKVLPENLTDTVEVQWTIATDTLLKDVVGGGSLSTGAASAFTVQLEQQGLEPSTTYFYCFYTATDTSAIGRTRTAGTNDEDLRFVVASCANYQMGYFNAYRDIARQTDIDAVLFLGDYIYEYGTRDNAIRPHIPGHEILSLQDYRSRYAQYRLDPDLMEAHRLHPFITIWDDHEFANDSYVSGAQNHQQEEDDWEKRKENARKAFFEWIPVKRQPGTNRVYRYLSYGNMADLFMIDGRVEGRSDPIADYNDPLRYDTARTMLGAEQRQWLINGLENSQAHWRVLVNDVMFAPMDLGQIAKERRFNMDAWDGFVADRNSILDVVGADSVRNFVVVTGDIHTAWGIELTKEPTDATTYDRKTGMGLFGAEFVTPSISSPNLDEMRGKLAAKLSVPYIKNRKRNPHLHYLNTMDHGYMLVELTKDEAKATWIYVQSVKKPTDKLKRKLSWAFPYNGKGLERRKP